MLKITYPWPTNGAANVYGHRTGTRRTRS